jgi:HlyD family secretion protein
MQKLDSVNVRVLSAVVLLTAAISGSSVYVALNRTEAQEATPTPTLTASVPIAVTALGRLEPLGEVVKLSVINAQDSRVEQILVKEGDAVEAGQVIAVLHGLDRRKAALEEAERNVAVYQAKLNRIRAGDAKTGEIQAQQATIRYYEAMISTQTQERQAQVARYQAELQKAEADYRRHAALHQEGAISLSELEGMQRTWQTTQEQLRESQAQLANTTSTLQAQIQQERATLAQLIEVRPVDVQEAQAELEYALTQVTKARADLEEIYVRVPVAGRILKINTRIGEQVNTEQGIVELGQTDQMYAIAEVYESEIGKIKMGQTATVVSEHGGFEGELQGVVDHIGLQIKKIDVLDSDPTADKDARVVEVKVRLNPESSQRVAGLTNLQVRVKINLDEAES